MDKYSPSNTRVGKLLYKFQDKNKSSLNRDQVDLMMEEIQTYLTDKFGEGKVRTVYLHQDSLQNYIKSKFSFDENRATLDVMIRCGNQTNDNKIHIYLNSESSLNIDKIKDMDKELSDLLGMNLAVRVESEVDHSDESYFIKK